MSNGIRLQGHEDFYDFFQRSLGIIGTSLVLQSGKILSIDLDANARPIVMSLHLLRDGRV